ncbi:MAG: hypothetical protein VKI83_09585 [Synechococcaceae cyanobacterium]|nr:hypothetical protein [Synechococcaceae cyanobacterium]
MSLIARAINEARLAKSRLKHKTVRFKVSDLSRFYSNLNAAGITYVVLRWADEIPFSIEAERSYSRDIDHLVATGNLDTICRIASAQPGPVSVDFYTATGERGGAYRRMPYYMPSLAETILARRVRLPSGIWVPCPEDALLSFVYHLIYHKGCNSGIPSGLDLATIDHPARDYATEARRLAQLAGLALPEPITLLNLHDFLKAHGWSMALDLMPRWQDQHALIGALQALENERAAALLKRVADITLFIVREDPIGEQGLGLIRERIGERFTILAEIVLDPEAQRRLMTRTRGGDWSSKGCNQPNRPTRVLICRNASEPGALPGRMTAAKAKRRYPHITTTDVLIKRDIRKEVATTMGLGRICNVLHATDNPLEGLEALRAIHGPGFTAALERLSC